MPDFLLFSSLDEALSFLGPRTQALIPLDDLDQDDPVTDLPCKCQEYSTCSWSKHLVDQIHVTPKDKNIRNDLIKQFQTQICNLKNRHI